MKIQPIASSSKGNSILISDGASTLLLDAGISFAELSRHISVSAIDGVLISHEHGDHVKAVPELLKRGVECYSSEGTWGKLIGELNRWPAQACYHKLPFQVATFRVMPFNAKHDCRQPFGYLIESLITNERLVYAVDTGEMWFVFDKVTHYLIEANHYEKGLKNSDLDEKVKERIANNHLSFEKLLKYFQDSDLSHTKQIHLLHLSAGNSNQKQFVQDLQAEYGIPVFVHGE